MALKLLLSCVFLEAKNKIKLSGLYLSIYCRTEESSVDSSWIMKAFKMVKRGLTR